MVNKPNKEWLEAEKLVALIERAIDPSAKVLHNKKLDVLEKHDLKKRRRQRQIDVLIVTGPPHRETLTIVEVQKRNTPVELNTFQGWLTKLEEVGAQHLICVSHQPFPESVRDIAESESQKVKLIQLEDATPNTIPLQLINSKLISTKRDFTSATVHAYFSASPDHTPRQNFKSRFGMHEKILSLDKTELFSVIDLANDHAQAFDENVGLNTKTISYENKIYICRKKEFLKASRFELNITWKVSRREISPSILTYCESEVGVLAWILELKDPETGFWAKIPLVQNKNGDFLISNMHVTSREGTEFSLSVFDIVPQ